MVKMDGLEDESSSLRCNLGPTPPGQPEETDSLTSVQQVWEQKCSKGFYKGCVYIYIYLFSCIYSYIYIYIYLYEYILYIYIYLYNVFINIIYTCLIQKCIIYIYSYISSWRICLTRINKLDIRITSNDF